MSKTKIEWATDAWNMTSGCTKVSAGCRSCYAEEMHRRLRAMGSAKYQHDFTEVRCHPEEIEKPLRWRKPRRIFVNSMSDLFHDTIPFDFIAAAFGVMAATPQHTYMVLTKRPGRMLECNEWLQRESLNCNNGRGMTVAARCFVESQRLSSAPALRRNTHIPCGQPWPLLNVILMTSVEDQATADERIPLLLQCPAAVHGISAEPLLGPLSIEAYTVRDCEIAYCFSPSGVPMHEPTTHTALGFAIVGGESGPKARPMHPAWARSVRDQCVAAGVPFFFKQWGEWARCGYCGRLGLYETYCPDCDNTGMCRVGKKAAGRELDGKIWDQMPEANK